MATPHAVPGFTLQVRRVFAAPREKVFAAWAQREQLEQWMCRDAAAHLVIHHLQEIRTGGRYLIEVRDPANGQTYWGQGLYREVQPPEKIVFTWVWTKDRPEGENLHPGSEQTEVTVEFLARGTSTELVLTQALFGTEKLRDEHDRGWQGCFDVLETVLQSSSGR